MKEEDRLEILRKNGKIILVLLWIIIDGIWLEIRLPRDGDICHYYVILCHQKASLCLYERS